VPPEQPTPMAPRLIELCFQTAGVLEMGTRGKMGLPLRVERVAVHRAPEMAEGRRLFSVVRAAGEGVYHAQVLDEAGHVYLVLEGYRTVELPGGVDEAGLAPFRAAVS